MSAMKIKLSQPLNQCIQNDNNKEFMQQNLKTASDCQSISPSPLHYAYEK